jgi:hypothetical protein
MCPTKILEQNISNSNVRPTKILEQNINNSNVSNKNFRAKYKQLECVSNKNFRAKYMQLECASNKKFLVRILFLIIKRKRLLRSQEAKERGMAPGGDELLFIPLVSLMSVTSYSEFMDM